MPLASLCNRYLGELRVPRAATRREVSVQVSSAWDPSEYVGARSVLRRFGKVDCCPKKPKESSIPCSLGCRVARVVSQVGDAAMPFRVFKRSGVACPGARGRLRARADVDGLLEVVQDRDDAAAVVYALPSGQRRPNDRKPAGWELPGESRGTRNPGKSTPRDKQ